MHISFETLGYTSHLRLRISFETLGYASLLRLRKHTKEQSEYKRTAQKTNKRTTQGEGRKRKHKYAECQERLNKVQR